MLWPRAHRHGASANRRVGHPLWPQNPSGWIHLAFLSLPVCSASRIVHGSAQTPNSGDLLVAGNGAPPAPSSTPAGRPPLSPLIKSRPLISNPTDQGAPYPFAGHFAKESPKDIVFARKSRNFCIYLNSFKSGFIYRIATVLFWP